MTLSLDSKVYDTFQKYCEENAIMLSKKLELVMKEIMKNKKGILVLFMFFIGMFLPLVSGATILSDGFESGNLNSWTLTHVSGANDWTASTTDPYQGTYHAQSQPSSTTEPASVMERTISTSGYQNIIINYSRKLVGLDGPDEFQVEWSDGTTWVMLEQTGGNSANDAAYVSREYSPGSGANNNANFKIKIECTAGAVSEYCRVDSVNIFGDIIDNSSPTFSGYVEAPNNGSAYVSEQAYWLNVTVTESTGLSAAGIEFNGINKTVTNLSNVYMFNASDLSAGTYYYYWWANDTNGNFNTSGVRYYVVGKADPDARMYLNGARNNLTASYGTQVNGTALSGFSGVLLYRNGQDVTSAENGKNIALPAGYYNYTAFFAGNQNYSQDSETFFVNITKIQSSVSLIFDVASPQVYGTSVNASCTTDNPEGVLKLYRNGADVTLSEMGANAVLPAGTYNYVCNVTGTGNYTFAEDSASFIINKAVGDVQLELNGNADNLTVQYPQKTNISASTLYGNVAVYRDGASITFENGANVTRGGGYYNITAVSSGDENHTAKSITYWLNITKTTGSVSLTLNGEGDDLEVRYPQAVLAFASTPYGIVNLFRDGTDKTGENGNFVLLNAGYYNYTAVSSGNPNYSSSSLSYFVNITKGTNLVSLLLNSAAGNISLTYLNNLNASGSTTAGTIHLYRDGADVSIANGQHFLLGSRNY